MKAAQIIDYGDGEVFKISDVEKPTPVKGQVLVEVRAAGINPFDLKLAAGYLKDNIPLNLPVTMGGDFSGVVTEIGEDASGFKTGDEVYGSAIILGGGSGAYAQFATANADNIAFKPKSATFEEAAALPVVGVSAIQALEEHIKLQKDQKILIHGGAGGIGHVAIQLAKNIGAYVVTTVSSNDISFVKELGANEAIDYKAQKFEEILKDLDAVFDTVGGETTDKSFKILKKGGVIVSMLGTPNLKLAKEYGVTAIGQATKTSTKHLNRLTEFIDSGKLKVKVDKVFPLDKAGEAFDYQKKQSPRGKVVLKI